MIRQVNVENMQRHFSESIDGTAVAHLQRGLFEAHARRSGLGTRSGAQADVVRGGDIGFENPVTEDMTQTMLVRMGIVPADGKPPSPEEIRRNVEALRRFPDLDLSLEMMVRRMVGLLFIEVSAFHTFAWAEEVLSDTDLVAGDGAAADLVRYVRADETPHVDYLRTALTEMRDRTFVGESGATIPGAEVIATLWDASLELSLGPNRETFVRQAMGEIEHAVGGQSAARRHPRRVPVARRGGGRVKFGVFYEHQLPRPWTDDSEYRLIQDALDQIEFADALGIEYAWEVEHHFLEEYSHSERAEVFLAAASQRTKNIRLGHGIVQTPPPFNHPARIAERVAMLDLVSDGRADFGTGESSSEAELGGFMVDPDRKRAMWEEGLRVAVRCMTETPFTGHSGEFVTMPPRNVVPKPRQKPHPPLWVACSGATRFISPPRRRSARLASCSVRPGRSEVLGRRLLLDAGRRSSADRRCRERERGVRDHDVHVSRRRGRSTPPWDRGRELFGYSLCGSLRRVRAAQARVSRVCGTSSRSSARRTRLRPRSGDRGGGERRPARRQSGARQGIGGLRGAVGTPDQLREYLRRYEDCGVDQVIFCFQAGKNRHEHIMEALELFGREVLPEFKDRDEELTRKKRRARARRRRRDGAEARRGSSAAPDGRLRVPRHPAMADRFGNDEFHGCSTSSPSSRPWTGRYRGSDRRSLTR